MKNKMLLASRSLVVIGALVASSAYAACDTGSDTDKIKCLTQVITSLQTEMESRNAQQQQFNDAQKKLTADQDQAFANLQTQMKNDIDGEIISNIQPQLPAQINKALTDFQTEAHQYFDASVNSLVAPGTVVAYAGEVIPPGWLLCDGSEKSADEFPKLAEAIGSTYGAREGSSFHLPDYRGEFLRGVDKGAGIDPNAATRTALNPGGNTGDNVGTYQEDMFKAHSHDFTIDTTTLKNFNSGYKVVDMPSSVGSAPYSYVSTNSIGHTNETGGLETRPKNVSVYFIIKT